MFKRESIVRFIVYGSILSLLLLAFGLWLRGKLLNGAGVDDWFKQLKKNLFRVLKDP